MASAQLSCLVLMARSGTSAHLDIFCELGEELGFKLVPAGPRPVRAREILGAAFILADLTGGDPEVMYDVGVAHSFGKRVFLVTDKLDGVPYDLRSSRVWALDGSINKQHIRAALAQFLKLPYVLGPVRLFVKNYAFFGQDLFWRRTLGFAIDALLWILVFACALSAPAAHPTIGWNRVVSALTVPESQGKPNLLLLLFYLPLAYFVLSSWIFGGSLGQLSLGLRVVQIDNRRLTFGQALGRTFLCIYLSWGIFFLIALRGPGFRAWHDTLSGSVVVRKQALF